MIKDVIILNNPHNMNDLEALKVRLPESLQGEEWFQALQGTLTRRTGAPDALGEALGEVLGALEPFFRPEVGAEQKVRLVAVWMAFKLGIAGREAVHPEILNALA